VSRDLRINARRGKEGPAFDRKVRVVDGRELIEGLAQIFDADFCHVRLLIRKMAHNYKPSVPARMVTKFLRKLFPTADDEGCEAAFSLLVQRS
jgi:hypothetical protein